MACVAGLMQFFNMCSTFFIAFINFATNNRHIQKSQLPEASFGKLFEHSNRNIVDSVVLCGGLNFLGIKWVVSSEERVLAPLFSCCTNSQEEISPSFHLVKFLPEVWVLSRTVSHFKKPWCLLWQGSVIKLLSLLHYNHLK